MYLKNFDPHQAVEGLARVGGVVIPRYFSETFRTETLARLLQLSYRRRESVHGTGRVRQDYFDVRIPHTIPFLRDLREMVREHLHERFQLVAPYPFASPLAFEEVSVQRYEPGSEGIGSHKDDKHCKNLIALLIFTGTCDFIFSEERGGRDRVLQVGPADLVLVHADGFLGENGPKRPFHAVTNIPELRISVGFRDLPIALP